MDVFNSILPIFVLVVVGNIIRRTGIVPMEDWRGVELICFWLFFPAILCFTLATVELKSLPIGALSITVLAVTGIMWTILFALKPVLQSRNAMTNAEFTSVFQAGSRFHGFIALAIVLKLYGETGAA
ncbi:MAG: AEC family transporter, partial [Pseudomonadota bacterium]